MKYIIGIIFCLSIYSNVNAQIVTASPNLLPCGTTAVTFEFTGCAFTGDVFISHNGGSDITFAGGTNQIVMDGEIILNITVTATAPTTYNFNFFILNSTMQSCAPNGSTGTVAMSHNCTPPPSNDDCSGAIPLSISSDVCNYINFSTTNSTISGNTPSCGIPDYNDLWYTFTANNDTVFLEFASLPGPVGFYAIYDDCPSNFGFELDCGMAVPGTGTTFLEFTGLTVGFNYVLQMLFLPNQAGNDQQICLHSTTSNCPTNITVSNAGPNLPNMPYQCSGDIITSGATNLSASSIIFDAGQNIELNAGFDTGVFPFDAIIGGCTP